MKVLQYNCHAGGDKNIHLAYEGYAYTWDYVTESIPSEAMDVSVAELADSTMPDVNGDSEEPADIRSVIEFHLQNTEVGRAWLADFAAWDGTKLQPRQTFRFMFRESILEFDVHC